MRRVLSFLGLIALHTAYGSSSELSQALHNTWEGIKIRNVDPYDVKLIHRPYSETPHDAVSEGVGYGLIIALYSGDQTYFDKIWDDAEKYMWNGKCYDWRVDQYGHRTATGAATDAEQDIALALIFAQRLVDKKDWAPHENPTYGQRAQDIMDSMWNSQMISPSHNVAPGAGWGGEEFVNPGYFAPAWYRIFEEVDQHGHDWNSVIDSCYDILYRSPGIENGLVPDWMSPHGGYYEGDLGYNTYGKGRYLFKDAIRVFWRIGTDYMWFGEPRARDFLENAHAFIKSKGGASGANFYQMNGDLIPPEDVWEFNGGQKHRPRREHSPLTIGMWSIVPASLNESDTEKFETELLRYYNRNSTYWGLTTGEETININEMYFEQFLAWFGGIVLNGTWSVIH